MKKQWFLVVFLALGLSLFLSVGADRAAAQGPAGAGAAGATTQSSHSSHSLNPIKWVKKDKSSTDACAPFTALNECVAALHASHNLGLDFNCLRADVTGVLTGADLSGCTGAGEKALSLTKAIHALKPDAKAKGEAKNAEQQAKDDLKELGV